MTDSIDVSIATYPTTLEGQPHVAVMVGDVVIHRDATVRQVRVLDYMDRATPVVRRIYGHEGPSAPPEPEPMPVETRFDSLANHVHQSVYAAYRVEPGDLFIGRLGGINHLFRFHAGGKASMLADTTSRRLSPQEVAVAIDVFGRPVTDRIVNQGDPDDGPMTAGDVVAAMWQVVHDREAEHLAAVEARLPR